MIKGTSRLLTSALILWLAVGLASGGRASARGRDKSNSGATQVARLDRSFTLRAGRQVTLKGASLRIKFATVEDDSRCPSDVTCVWAGKASVRLEVTMGGKDRKSLVLSTGRGAAFVSEMLYHGYKVRLVGLNPYPRSTQQISPDDYTVTLLVSKAQVTSKATTSLK